jgi:glycosyltransferase involved in cell wall biosynthesis
MRLLQICPFFPPSPLDAGSGSINVVYNLGKELVKKGHEVSVYASSYLAAPEVDVRASVAVDGIAVRLFPYVARYKAFAVTPEMAPYLKRTIAEFDVVHLHELRTFQNVAAHYYARKYGVPYVVHGHGTISRAIRLKRLKWVFDMLVGYRIIDDAARLIAVSNEERGHYREMRANPEKISVIYNGMDVTAFENVSKNGSFKRKYNVDGKMILYLGRIVETKGIEVVIQAFAELIKEVNGLTLIIAGRNYGEGPKLRRLVKKMGIEATVRFTGFLSESCKKAAYADAAMFVHPVRYMGGVGLTPLEAILCGTPIIVTDECGEVVRDANCGCFVEYGDVTGLKEAMKALIENPAQGKEMVDRGAKYVREHLAWEKVATKFEEVYQSCVD